MGDTTKRVTERGFELMEYCGVEGDRDAGLQTDTGATTKRQREK
jgi:hypothetical protein